MASQHVPKNDPSNDDYNDEGIGLMQLNEWPGRIMITTNRAAHGSAAPISDTNNALKYLARTIRRVKSISYGSASARVA